MITKKEFVFKYEEPDYQTWNDLRSYVGWIVHPFEVYEKVLENSLCFVTTRYNGKLIGMGRLVGDNITSFYIQGLVVNPYYQKRGIGTEIVNRLIHYAKRNGVTGASISLFAHKDTEEFYKKLGFQMHPNTTRGAGMSQKL